MHSHSEAHPSPYTPRQLFDLVAQVQHYPQFIPWVAAARIHETTPERLVAELKIRFAAVSTSYTSEVFLHPPASDTAPCAIEVKLVRGPFRHLMNYWEFVPQEGGGSLIRFTIEFAFASTMFENLIGGLFDKAAHKMVSAFEQRADVLYG